jgi:hypothetical protein
MLVMAARPHEPLQRMDPETPNIPSRAPSHCWSCPAAHPTLIKPFLLITIPRVVS